MQNGNGVSCWLLVQGRMFNSNSNRSQWGKYRPAKRCIRCISLCLCRTHGRREKSFSFFSCVASTHLHTSLCSCSSPDRSHPAPITITATTTDHHPPALCLDLLTSMKMKNRNPPINHYILTVKSIISRQQHGFAYFQRRSAVAMWERC